MYPEFRPVFKCSSYGLWTGDLWKDYRLSQRDIHKERNVVPSPQAEAMNRSNFEKHMTEADTRHWVHSLENEHGGIAFDRPVDVSVEEGFPTLSRPSSTASISAVLEDTAATAGTPPKPTKGKGPAKQALASKLPSVKSSRSVRSHRAPVIADPTPAVPPATEQHPFRAHGGGAAVFRRSSKAEASVGTQEPLVAAEAPKKKKSSQDPAKVLKKTQDSDIKRKPRGGGQAGGRAR